MHHLRNDDAGIAVDDAARLFHELRNVKRFLNCRRVRPFMHRLKLQSAERAGAEVEEFLNRAECGRRRSPLAEVPGDNGIAESVR